MLTFFTPFDVKMIQISTFPAAPSTERVPSLAKRVASLRYSINLRFFNNRVPALVYAQQAENVGQVKGLVAQCSVLSCSPVSEHLQTVQEGSLPLC